jgi:hypothetical protein
MGVNGTMEVGTDSAFSFGAGHRHSAVAGGVDGPPRPGVRPVSHRSKIRAWRSLLMARAGFVLKLFDARASGRLLDPMFRDFIWLASRVCVYLAPSNTYGWNFPFNFASGPRNIVNQILHPTSDVPGCRALKSD